MKNMLLAIAAACLIAVPGASAQAQKPQPEHNQAQVSRIQNRVEHHLNYLTTVLSLSSTQQQQAMAILMNAANDNRPLIANVRAERNDLRAAVQKNEATSTIKQFSDKIGNDVSSLAMNEASAGEQLYKILSPEQQTKLTQLQNENYGRFDMGWGASDTGGI